MAKLPSYMKIRNLRYSVRVPVPAAIQGLIGKTEITRTLNTGDLMQAKKNYHDVMAEIYKTFETASAKLKNSAPASLVGFAPLNAVKSWHQLRTAEVIARTKAMFENAKELEDYKLGLRHSLVELTSINKKQQYNAVEYSANQILLEAGYPSKADKSIPNIDFEDPKYLDLLEYLVSSKIELKELELSRLGDKIHLTPNGGVFVNNVGQLSVVATGTTLSKLIDEYMSLKGGVGKGKTIGDKNAAFEYLTRLVGPNFLVENLTRNHFIQIRSILEAYPKNAKKLKVLKGKTLMEASNYAQQNKLPLMGKANANKIIRRLKSLMSYAVSTGLVTINPCAELEFHISAAEKASTAMEKFTDEQLAKLFKSHAFQPHYPKGPAMYWVPLIALFHGFRMEEILLLTLDEVKLDEKTGVCYFDLTQFTTDHLKNSNAMRRVPIHKELNKLGFSAYLIKCKTHKGKRLFPELKKATGLDPTYRKLFSPKYSRYLIKAGIKTKNTVFHSFRRNFSVACSNGEVPIDFENALAGWSLKGGQNGTYKKPKDLSLQKLKEMIDRVDYPDVDLSHLYC
ncbi:MAG: site-specific integrase [Litorimonas sp.]